MYISSLKSSEMKRLRTALTTRVSLPPSYLDTAKASGVSGAVPLSLFKRLSIICEHWFILHMTLVPLAFPASRANDVPSYGLSTGMETAYIRRGGNRR